MAQGGNNKFLVLGLAGLVALLISVSSSSALIGSLAIEPVDDPVTGEGRGVFRLVVEPGTVVEDTMIIKNTSDKTKVAFVFPSGYELIDGEITEVQLPDDAPDEPGKWIEIDTQELTLAPQTQRLIKFRINVPETIDVGDHMATLFVQGGQATNVQNKGRGLSINVRAGVRVYMTVPGEINRDLAVTDIGHHIFPFWKLFSKKLSFALTFQNDGNVTIRPLVDLTVRGLFGEAGTQEGMQFVSIRRGTTETSEKEWIKRAPYFGRFVANFEIHLGEHEQVNEDGTKTILPDEVINPRYVFWVFPWIEIIYLIVIIFILYLLRSLWLYIVIINRLKTKTEVYMVKKGDTLTTIGSKLGINPRILVKFNLIPWPYEVNPGDKLLIPKGKYTGKEWHGQMAGMMKDKGIWAGVWGHLFRKRNVHKMTHKHVQPSSQAGSKPKTVVAEKGDTIEDVADFLEVDKEDIIKANKLKAPYKLKPGQELEIPPKKKSKGKQSKRRKK